MKRLLKRDALTPMSDVEVVAMLRGLAARLGDAADRELQRRVYRD